MDNKIWKGRSVLLTGHTGFKGAWLSLWLQRLGAKVTGYALEPPSTPSLFELIGVSEGMRSVHGDVRDLAHLSTVCDATQPEVVFHLAAQALVRPSYEEPVETYATNVLGTVHLLEAVRRTPGVRAVVIVTSDKCYENREWVWPYRENEPMGGHDPYSNSKGCAELVTAAYRDSFFTSNETAAIASARAGNVIGGGDWGRDRLIPDIVRAAAAGETVRIRSPHAVRPWQHVLEPLSGYLCLAEALWRGGHDFAEGWNFGPDADDARPVGWIVERLAERWPAVRSRLDKGPQPHEAHTLKLDASKARSRLGWQPRLRLGETLDWVATWYRTWQEGGDLRQLSAEQISRYEALHGGAEPRTSAPDFEGREAG